MHPDARRTLVLVRHSLPVVEPDVRPSRWVLSDEGRGRCVALADLELLDIVRDIT